MASPMHRPSDPNVRQHRGPRYRPMGRDTQDLSESYQSFVQHTDGLTGRLRLTGLDGMRAGTTNNPYSMARRFLVAGRSAGLPKEWALRFSVWVSRQTDALWPMEATPLRALEEKAMVAEAKDDLAEKRCDLERNAITLRERIQSQTAEVVCDMLVLARLERELEDCDK